MAVSRAQRSVAMTKRIFLLACSLAGLAGAQTPAPAVDHGLSYYHYSLGHLYSELAAGYAYYGYSYTYSAAVPRKKGWTLPFGRKNR